MFMHYLTLNGTKYKEMKKGKGLSRETKELYTSLGRSLFLCFVAIFAIVTATVAWFVNNTSVTGDGFSISANDNFRYYLATKAEDMQGKYDDNSDDNSILANEIKKFYSFHGINTIETINGLPSFSIGDNKITGNDEKEYIVAKTDDISLMINYSDNVNNYEASSIEPGSRGTIKFYIIPTKDFDDDITVNIRLAGYRLAENESFTSATASQINFYDTTLGEIVKNHILLFSSAEDKGYSNYVEPFIDNDGTIVFSISISRKWENNNPEEVLIYWCWPRKFEDYVFVEQKESLFSSYDSSEYKKMIDRIFENRLFFAYTGNPELLEKPSSEMSNAQILQWSRGYNKGDQLIGDNVSYFVWSIETVNEVV